MCNSGIYKIVNIVNNNMYIGSSSNLDKRKKDHFRLLLINKHQNRYLQNAYNKYGKENFVFEIIEYAEDNLIHLEQKWINNSDFSTLYNIRPIADRNTGIKMSEETKNKLRIANIGKKYSEESKEKKRKWNMEHNWIPPNSSGRKYSKEYIFKKSRPVINVNTLEVFISLADAGSAYNVNFNSIRKCCVGITKHSAKCKWMYVCDYEKIYGKKVNITVVKDDISYNVKDNKKEQK